jgi:hypothetical protein
MLRESLAEDLRADEVAPGLVRPAWSDYCFANVPDTVRSLFGTDARRPLPADALDGIDGSVEHVVCVWIDGFGWNHLRRARPDHPFLDELADRATVTPLTSTYPSETAAAVSTFHTATQPVEHGVLGWFAHEERLGGNLQTLPFADLDGEVLESVLVDPDPSVLIDERPIYETLPADSYLVAPEGQGETRFSAQTTTGATPVDFRNVAQGAYRVRERLESAEWPTFVQLYVPQVDTLSHHSGVRHPETDAQLAAVCAAVRREIVERLDPDLAARTAFLLTADHGEVDATPETTVALDGLDLEPHLERDADGAPIPAQGGPRNLQFHARTGHRDQLVAELERGLAPLDPLVLTGGEVREAELFGDCEPSDQFERRRPDVLAVPREGFAWYEAEDADGHLSYVGMHGGMHEDETLVPFAAAAVSDLQG